MPPDCESGLPWYAACMVTLSECLTNISDPEGQRFQSNLGLRRQLSYITIPRMPMRASNVPYPYGH